MPITNLSSVTYTAAEEKTMNDALATLAAIINPKSTNLSSEEKSLYGSIAEQNKLVVQKVFQYMETHPEIVPFHVNKDEYVRDNTSRNQLEGWLGQSKMLVSNMQNTKILLDYDVYQTTLTIYRNIRYMAKENVPGMAAIYRDLQQFFQGGGKSPDEEITPVI